MKFSIYSVVTLTLSFYAVGHVVKENGKPYNLVFNKPGNVSVIGIFDGRVGGICGLVSAKALEEMASAIWAVEALNKNKFLRGITLGLSAFETCQGNLKKENDFFETIKRNFELDNATYNAGFLTTIDPGEKSNPTEKANDFTFRIRHIVDEFTLTDLIVQLLANLSWTTVDEVHADSESVLNFFSESASYDKIAIRKKLLTNDSARRHRKSVSKNGRVIILITTFERISRLTEMNEMKKEKALKLILAPTDLVFHPLRELPRDTIVLLPSIGDEKILARFLMGNKNHKEFLSHREPTKSPLFIGVAAAILKMLAPLREAQDEICKKAVSERENSCSQIIDLSQFLKKNGTFFPEPDSLKISPDDVRNVFDVFNLEANSNGEIFFYVASLANAGTSEDAAVFQLFNLKAKSFHPILLMINDNLFKNREIVSKWNESERTIQANDKSAQFSDRKKPETVTASLTETLMNGSMENDEKEAGNETRNSTQVDSLESDSENRIDFNSDGKNESCGWNFEKNRCPFNRSADESVVTWRNSTWVTVNTSLGFIGIVSVASIMALIVRRISRGDVLEGSSAFIISLMVSVIFTFASSLSYHLESRPDDSQTLNLICGYRMNGPSIAYSILFSLMLSRSLMLASGEVRDGFVNHINGYLQSVLFLSLLGIQISLTSQNWLREETYYESNCPEVHAGNRIIVSLVYNFVLLILQIFVSPFIIRLKRNYREGLLLAVSAFFIVLSWSAWIGCYFFLSDDFKDAVVAIGLNSTGFVLLVFAFAPRTYLMTIAICRYKAGNFVPSLDQNIVQNVSDHKYKSNRTANDSRSENEICETYNVGLSNPNFVQ